MINKDEQLIRDVMRRVRFIHLGRALLSPAMIRAIVLLASCVSVLLMVSVVHVVDNMSHLPSFAACVSYIFGAYMNTSWGIQTIIFLALAAGAWLVGDIARNLRIIRAFSPFARASN